MCNVGLFIIIIAKNLLTMGVDVLTVVKATGLTEEDIKK